MTTTNKFNEEKLPDGVSYFNPNYTQDEREKLQEEFWDEWMKRRNEYLRSIGFPDDFPVDWNSLKAS